MNTRPLSDEELSGILWQPLSRSVEADDREDMQRHPERIPVQDGYSTVAAYRIEMAGIFSLFGVLGALLTEYLGARGAVVLFFSFDASVIIYHLFRHASRR